MQIFISILALTVAGLAFVVSFLNYSKTQSAHTRQIRITQSTKIISLCHKYLAGIGRVYDGGVFPEEEELFERAKNNGTPEDLVWARLPLHRYIKIRHSTEEDLRLAERESELFFGRETLQKISAILEYGDNVASLAHTFLQKKSNYHGYQKHLQNSKDNGVGITQKQQDTLDKKYADMCKAEDEFLKPENYPQHDDQKRLMTELIEELRVYFPDDSAFVQSISKFALRQ